VYLDTISREIKLLQVWIAEEFVLVQVRKFVLIEPEHLDVAVQRARYSLRVLSRTVSGLQAEYRDSVAV